MRARRAAAHLLLALLSAAPLGCAGRRGGTHSPGRAAHPVEDLDTAFALGRALVRYDALAWIATDAVVATDIDTSRLRGWLVSPGSGTEGEIVLLGELDDGAISVVASVRCDLAEGPGSCVVAPDFVPRPLSDQEATMRRAIDTAGSDRFFFGTQPKYNHVIVPGAPYGVDAGWIVYFFAATTESGVVPLGRHYRFDVSADGDGVLARRTSHRSDIISRPQVPEGAELAAIASNSLYDPHPSEFLIHDAIIWGVALSLVACDGSLWTIDGAKITQLEPSRSPRDCIDPWTDPEAEPPTITTTAQPRRSRR